MATNTRFTTGTHTLVLLARQPEAVQSSENLAAKLQTNAVVIRRILAQMQHAGLVRNHKGPAGGSQLLKPAAQISLGDVYRALEPGPLFHDNGVRSGDIRRTGVELRRSLATAEEAFLQALDATSLQQLVRRSTPRTAPKRT